MGGKKNVRSCLLRKQPFMWWMIPGLMWPVTFGRSQNPEADRRKTPEHRSPSWQHYLPGAEDGFIFRKKGRQMMITVGKTESKKRKTAWSRRKEWLSQGQLGKGRLWLKALAELVVSPRQTDLSNITLEGPLLLQSHLKLHFIITLPRSIWQKPHIICWMTQIWSIKSLTDCWIERDDCEKKKPKKGYSSYFFTLFYTWEAEAI